MEMLFFIIFVVILVVIIANLGQYSNQVVTERREAETEYIGRVGEETTEAIVSRIKECEYTLTNLYIPTAKGGTTEIDLVAFTNRGLLVLETKNYSGTIHGDEDSDQWFASVYTQNNYFYNPLKQNATHTKYLDKAVALNIPIYSIIVFSDRCSLEYLPHSFKDVYICQMSTLMKTIEEIFDENPACVPAHILSTVYNRVKNYANPSEEVIRRHKEYVRSKR